MRTRIALGRGPRRGLGMVYIVIIMTVLMGICSLAVDMGRYEAAHNEMYGAAVAAARAGAANMSGGQTAATTAATNAATANKTDGALLPSGDLTITYGFWNTGTSTFTSVNSFTTSQVPPTAGATVNACRVTITYSVPLAFGRVIGMSSKTATETSIAMVSIQVDTPYVYATGDPWLAGEPTGTQGSQADPNYAGVGVAEDHLFPFDLAGPGGTSKASYWSGGTHYPAQPYSSPVQVAFAVTPGSTITITNVSGTASNDHDTGAYQTADGSGQSSASNAAANGVSEHGIADATMPLGSMNAVFLNANLPDNQTVPPPLNFSTQAARDYVSLSPKLQQVFFVGNGQTSGGTQQEIVVPAGATRLFIGYMDGWEWDNNLGGYNATVTQTLITTVQ